MIFNLSFGQKKTFVLKKDSAKIEQRSFDKSKLEAYKSQKKFNYKVEKTAPNIFERFWEWLKRGVKKFLSYLFDDIEPVVGFLSYLLKALPWLILGIVLFLIVKFFLKINTRNIINGKNNIAIAQLTEEEDLLNHQDLPKLIQQAIAEENFRLAVRYYYLQILQKLTEKELIIWQQEKTNEDYIRELKLHKHQNQFKEITYLYDFVWYGNFDITQNDFIKAEQSFKKIATNIG